MKSKFLSKCIIGILLSSFLVTPLASAVPAFAATAEKSEVKGMKLVTENDDVKMYYGEEDAIIALVYKDSGEVVKTKVMDGDGNAVYKSQQKSDVVVDYFAEDKSTSTTTINNYDMSIDTLDEEAGVRTQVEFEEIENGIKMKFVLKEDKLSLDAVPREIPQETMREKIYPGLSKEDRELLDKYYRHFESHGSYYRSTTEGVPQSVIKDLMRIFFESGKYTAADMAADNANYGHESTFVNMEVHVNVEYVLDGKDLLVKIPMSEFSMNDEEAILNALTILPYFMSATTEEDGYMVVPDGIGAIIKYNNGLLNSKDYVSRVYGSDTLIDATAYDSTEYFANMPMYGMVYDTDQDGENDYAMLSIVEAGATMAELHAKISGKIDSYNNAYWKFYITEKENVATTEHSAVSVNKFTQDTFTDSIVIRYQMLEKENASYTGIAKAYQNYLIEKGELAKTERKEDASLYLEILGAVKESQNFIGIPYQGVAALTTFTEAKKMLEYFKISGVKDIEAELTGWMNRGDSHTALTDIDIASAMGSKGELARITEFAHEYDFGFYTGLNLQKAFAGESMFSLWSTNSFAGKYAAKFLSSEYAQLGTTKLGLDNLRINDYSAYLVSPNMLKAYTNKVIKNLSKLEIEGLSIKDLGTLLLADHNDKAPVSRENAIAIENEAAALLADKYDIMLSNPYDYAWKYADAITDVPSRSNEYTVFAYDVPLLPLVLDGCVSYSTTALNNDTQKDISEMILKCIETRMNPKFYLMYAEMDELENTDEHYDELSISYMTWRKDIVSLYEEYNEFYELVYDADIENHETLHKGVVKVTYTNGVEVYVNYTDRAYMVEDGFIGADSYLIVER